LIIYGTVSAAEVMLHSLRFGRMNLNDE